MNNFKNIVSVKKYLFRLNTFSMFQYVKAILIADRSVLIKKFQYQTFKNKSNLKKYSELKNVQSSKN